MKKLAEILELIATNLGKNQIAIDKNGQEVIDLEGKPLYTNADGTIDLYHATNKKSYETIMKTGKWKPAGYEQDVFFSNFPRGGEGFGDYVIHVKILPKFVRLDDAFRTGEVHVAIYYKTLERVGKIIRRISS